MPNTFLISDTHFGHHNILKFTYDNGLRIRPYWETVEEMDEDLVKNWNGVVNPKDKVYHLGDVVINRKNLRILDRLNGDKVLIKGNHDIFHLDEYAAYFRDIRAYHIMDRLILSHIPIHKDSIMRFRGNVHGHLHGHRVKDSAGRVDSMYFCVACENIEFTPIEFNEVRTLL